MNLSVLKERKEKKKKTLLTILRTRFPEHTHLGGCRVAARYAKGNMQLYSVAQQRSQALEAHAAAFSTHQVPGNTVKSQVVAFAQKTLQPDGQISSKLHVIELGAQAAGVFVIPGA